MNLRLAKARRYLRRVPEIAIRRFFEPIFSSSQILTGMVAIIGLAIFLNTASRSERDVEYTQWSTWAEAFGIALAIWAFISLATAPFVARREELQSGTWKRHHFTYFEPRLVAAERFEIQEGKGQKRLISFQREGGSAFVNYRVELDPPIHDRTKACLLAVKTLPSLMDISLNWTEVGHSIGRRLPPNAMMWLHVHMEPSTDPVTVRVYCNSYFLGRDHKQHA
jgi:hypothetical protein